MQESGEGSRGGPLGGEEVAVAVPAGIDGRVGGCASAVHPWHTGGYLAPAFLDEVEHQAKFGVPGFTTILGAAHPGEQLLHGGIRAGAHLQR